jgi:O-acetyl-ADP-ribose deacetylase (regulator of RNase III)
VVFHPGRGGVELRLVQYCAERIERRERLVAKLRDEPGLGRVVVLEGLSLVPDVPVVDVALLEDVGVLGVRAAGG